MKVPPGFPHRQTLMEAALKALAKLGSSATVEELMREVISLLRIPDDLVELKHITRSGEVARTHLDYELAWARTYLKQLGFVENSKRGIWTLTVRGREGSLPKLKGAEELAAPSRDWQQELAGLLEKVFRPAARKKYRTEAQLGQTQTVRFRKRQGRRRVY